MRLKILIDMDDTIVDLLGAWVEYLNYKYRLSVNVEDITEWDITKFFPTLTPSQIYEPLKYDYFWGLVKPKSLASHYICELIRDGHEVYICTASYYESLKYKMDLALFKYFDYISWGDVIVTRNKQMIDADILIDDAVHNLIGGKYKGILMTAPHNKSVNAREVGVYRADNWEEIYNIIKEIREEATV